MMSVGGTAKPRALVRSLVLAQLGTQGFRAQLRPAPSLGRASALVGITRGFRAQLRRAPPVGGVTKRGGPYFSFSAQLRRAPSAGQ